eukprot:1169866-Amphidinium_carterae.2
MPPQNPIATTSSTSSSYTTVYLHANSPCIAPWRSPRPRANQHPLGSEGRERPLLALVEWHSTPLLAFSPLGELDELRVALNMIL